MNLYTLNRGFLRQSVIDEFLSVIWTERYYGDGAVELVVPATTEMIKKIPTGTFVALDGSRDVMIIETVNIEGANLKASGISLLPWLNNRFVRTSPNHEDRYWYLEDGPAGWTLWAMVYYMCAPDSVFLQPGAVQMGIPNPERLALPGLRLLDADMSGSVIKVGIPFGPLYDAMKEIATTYQVGMQALLESATDSGFSIGFRSYKGLDRTNSQTTNPVVRFSPYMDSLANIKELQSIAALKTNVYSFAPGLKPEEGSPALTTVPGVSVLTPSNSGFDVRALLVFADDITTDMVGADPAKVVSMLDSRADDALTTNRAIKAVDGEIVPENQFQYGHDYNLGDIIEVQGNSDIVTRARVTEYIRSQDAAGEKAYPTVTAIEK